MKLALSSIAVLLWFGTPAMAHRLDEYLQGTIISIEKDRVGAQVTLTPGVAVFRTLIADIDTNGDGEISEAEQRAYAGRVLHDLTVSIDGRRLKPRLVSMQFPAVKEMQAGGGEIQIEFDAILPTGGANRKLTIENHHQNRISAYQVNCLVPRDPGIKILAQNRNYSQSSYELDYVQANLSFTGNPLPFRAIALFLFAGAGLVFTLLASAKRHVK